MQRGTALPGRRSSERTRSEVEGGTARRSDDPRNRSRIGGWARSGRRRHRTSRCTCCGSTAGGGRRAPRDPRRNRRRRLRRVDSTCDRIGSYRARPTVRGTVRIVLHPASSADCDPYAAYLSPPRRPRRKSYFQTWLRRSRGYFLGPPLSSSEGAVKGSGERRTYQGGVISIGLERERWERARGSGCAGKVYLHWEASACAVPAAPMEAAEDAMLRARAQSCRKRACCAAGPALR